MEHWVGQHIEIFFVHQSPKITGVCKSLQPFGIELDTADDGSAVAEKITATFVPFNSVRSINLLHPRTHAEQEAKRKDLEERFRRHHLESAAPPSAEQIEILQKETLD